MVSESDISLISLGRYVIDSSGNITPEMFTSFLAVASARILLDAPDIDGVLKERAIGLLICHYIETGYGRTNLKSFSSGSGQTTMSDEGSPWMKEYREIITAYLQGQERETFKNSSYLSGVTHSDSSVRGL